MRLKIVLAFVVVILLIGCAPQLYMPQSNDPQLQNQLLIGRQLYIDNCSGCHNLHLPEQYTVKEWQIILDKMQPKAKISDELRAQIWQYLAEHVKVVITY